MEGNPLSYIDPYGLVKIITLTPGTPAYESALKTPDDPNSVIVIGHCGEKPNGDYLSQLLGPDGKFLPPASLADIIKNTNGYKPGMPIKLRSCGTGHSPSGPGSSYAQQLANQLGHTSTVTAPPGTITPQGIKFGGAPNAKEDKWIPDLKGPIIIIYH